MSSIQQADIETRGADQVYFGVEEGQRANASEKEEGREVGERERASERACNYRGKRTRVMMDDTLL